MQPLLQCSSALRLLLVAALLAAVCCGLPAAVVACSGAGALTVNSSAWGQHLAGNRDEQTSGFLSLFPLSLPAQAQGGSLSQINIEYEGDVCSGPRSGCPTANTRWGVYAREEGGEFVLLEQTANSVYNGRDGSRPGKPYIVTLQLSSSVMLPVYATKLWIGSAADSFFKIYSSDAETQSLIMSYEYSASSGLPASIPESELSHGGRFTLAFQLVACAGNCTDIPSAAFTSETALSLGPNSVTLFPLPIPEAARGQRLSELVIRYYGQPNLQAHVRWAVYRQRQGTGDYKRLEQTRGYDYPGRNVSHIGSAFEVRLPLNRGETVPSDADTLYVATATTNGYFLYGSMGSTPALAAPLEFAKGDVMPALIPHSPITQLPPYTVSFELVTCP